MSQFSTSGAFGNSAKRLGASEIAQFLTDNLEQIPACLGQTDIYMSADEIRCGPNGHISIVRRSDSEKKRGWWTDFKAAVHGTDGLDYVAHIQSCSISDAMRWASSSFTIPISHQRDQVTLKNDESRRAVLINKIRSASQVWQQTTSLAGTIGEVYLREVRGITCPIGSRIRFHRNLYHRSKEGQVTYWPAIVCAVMIAPHNHLTGVWRIYLSPDGQKAPVDKAKKGLGATFGHGGAVRLTDATTSHLHIAEGVENGLAAISMKPDISVWCAMAVAGFANMTIPQSVSRISILADNDHPHSPAYKALGDGARSLARSLSHRGVSVGIVRPPAEFKDLNAMLVGGGS